MSQGNADNMSSMDLLERQINAFDAAWQQGRPALAEFLTVVPADNALLRTELLAELIKIDLEYVWRAWHKAGSDPAQMPPCLEDYQAQFPELGPVLNLPVDLIAEEYRVRNRWGDRPAAATYFTRFPGAATLLQMMLPSVAEESLPDTSGTAETQRRQAAAKPIAATHDSAVALPAQPKTADEPALPDCIGRYQIISLLGRGSFGAVYLAHDEQLNRQVALKAPRADQLRTPSQQEAFLREARLAAQVRHPALVEVYDVGRADSGDCFIVLEYIAGESLADVAKRGRPEVTQVVRWIALVADAVHCAHKLGLVHCDLKPANILLDQHGQPHVADFGLAISEVDQRSQAGHVAGSPAYMAPEQIRGEAHRFDGRTDIWALGAVLYELLAGRKPFAGKNVREVFDEILNREPKPLRQLNETIPAALDSICLKCLAKDIKDRYTNAYDLAADLRQALSQIQLERSGAGDWRGSGGSPDDSWKSGLQRPSASVRTIGGRANLPPTAATSFVGRATEVRELTDWLQSDHTQLVTILGPGGMGKTRLALQVATGLIDDRPGGCWFADLTECQQPAEIAHAVAKSLNVPLPDNEPPVQAVTHILEYRQPALLVLDNFEQAVEAAQATIGVWRQAAPQVQFLVTSRVALRLADERCWELEPLATPADPANVTLADVEQIDALRLFTERARQTDSAFRVTEKNLPGLVRVCAAVEGMPLALELAAARVRIFNLDELARRLTQRFQILQSTRRDLSPRQQTLWGAIEWSVGLLTEWERQAFWQVCAFRGGFDWDAAEAIVDLAAFPQAPPTIDVIQSLRDKSLLTRQETPQGTRFGLYQAIREFGEQRWQKESEPAARQRLRERFSQYYVNWAEAENARLFSADAVEALGRLQLELPNLWAVQELAVAAADRHLAARAILAAARTMAIRGPAEQRLPRLERSLSIWGVSIRAPAPPTFPTGRGQVEGAGVFTAQPTDSWLVSHLGPVEPLLAHLLSAASEAAQAAGDWERAGIWVEQAVAVATRCHDQAALAVALRQQGEMCRQRSEPDAALGALAASENLARSLHDDRGVAECLSARAFVVWQRGEADLALQLLAEADQLVLQHGAHLEGIAIARRRGHVLAQQGDSFQALRCYAEAESTARVVGDERAIRLALGDRANVLATQGDFTGALECYQQAERLARKLGDKRGIAIAVGNRGILLSDRGEPLAALACYEQAEQLNRAMHTKYGIAVNLGNRGVALTDLGRCDEALACFAEAAAINRQTGNKFLLALNEGDRAGVWLHQEQWAEARNALQAALDLLEQVHSRHSVEAFIYQAQAAITADKLQDRAAAQARAQDALQLAHALQLTAAHPKVKVRNLLSAVTELGQSPGL